VPIRAALKKAEQWFIHVLHLDDTPHSIALGLAIGMFIAMTPTIGLQMLLTVAVSWLFRANKVAGVPLAWITNPATIVPVYSFNYVVGRTLVGGPGLGKVQDLLRATIERSESLDALAKAWLALMWHAALPLWVGCVLVGAVAAAITYVAMYYLIVGYRRHHRRLLAERAAREAQEAREAREAREAKAAPAPPAVPASGPRDGAAAADPAPTGPGTDAR